MALPYKKFSNPKLCTSENGPAAYPAPVAATGQTPFVQQPRKELKSLPSIRRLVRVELVLALVMVFLESIIHGVVHTKEHSYHFSACTLGTGIWVGLLGVITAGLGLGAFRSPFGNKCLIVAHFVMSIICAVADGIMISLGGACIAMLPWMMRGPYYYDSKTGRGGYKEPTQEQAILGRGLMTSASLLLLAASGHFISSIVSTALTCRNWCQDSQPAVAVVYFPGNQPTVDNHGNKTASDPCRIAVPSGAHVVFVPITGGNQAVLPPPQAILQQQPPQPDFTKEC